MKTTNKTKRSGTLAGLCGGWKGMRAAGLACALAALANGRADEVLFVNAVQSAPTRIAQVDLSTGSASTVLQGGYVGGGVYLNGSLYYQSQYFSSPYAKEFKRYDLTSHTTTLAFSQSYDGGGGFIINAGGFVADAAHSRLYYSYSDAKVWSITMEGSNPAPVELWDASTLGLSLIRDIAYADDQIFISGYVPYETGGSLGRVVRGVFSEAENSWSWSTILTINSAEGLAVDTTNGFLYLSGTQSNSSSNYKLYRSGLDGSSLQSIANTGDVYYTSLAVDSSAGMLYLAPRSTGTIQSMSLSGPAVLEDFSDVGGFAANLSLGAAPAPVPEPSQWGVVLAAVMIVLAILRRAQNRDG